MSNFQLIKDLFYFFFSMKKQMLATFLKTAVSDTL